MKLRFTLSMCLATLFLASCGTSGVQAPDHEPKINAGSSSKLDQLIKNYPPGHTGDHTSDAADSAWRYHGGMDYAALIRAGAHGEQKALVELMGLEMDGNAGEEHDSNMCDLLEGLGDKRFAAALLRCSPVVRHKVRAALLDFNGGNSAAGWSAAFAMIGAIMLLSLAAFLAMRPRELVGDRKT